MDDLDKVVRLNSLYDLYKDLLTSKQREYFEAFYFDNMSLKEIAVEFNVSRNAVYSQLQLVSESLEDYESKLHLVQKQNKKIELINKIKNSNVDTDVLIKELEEI